MSERRRIVVVDDDPLTCRLIDNALTTNGFEVHAFTDGRDALMKLHALAPDLILSDLLMPDLDGRTLFQVIKRSERLRDVPFIFLSGVQATDEIVASMDGGADDFVSKPFSTARLVAKVRAVLRLAERTQTERRADHLAGALAPGSTLALVKFCEESRLTGRLAVQAPGIELCAEFRGGELVEARALPARPGQDALDLLLAVEAGTYRIEQQRLDASALDAATRADGSASRARGEDPAGQRKALLPGGRLAKLDVRGAAVEVQTEAENRPHFVVTTVVAREGRVLRRIESAWSHALQRREDEPAAAREVERQHERVVAALRDLGSGAPRASLSDALAKVQQVDGALLAWALSFVAEQTRDQLGSVMTAALLRRTHARLVGQHALLAAFRVGNDGRVSLPRERGWQPPSAVAAMAAWTAAFTGEAAATGAGPVDVRQATRMMETELDRLGFYRQLGPCEATTD